eukprot:TRINITY_DN4204_c0_g1_i1.p1 TRINITY_DN4204_c0_g1~~TRINITY_DN4204_c0_g1_i1.p1  ORF type:complete len:414 (+),score=110.73 TRINITY_DN4204_c0_g1_i1:104-1243(+)
MAPQLLRLLPVLFAVAAVTPVAMWWLHWRRSPTVNTVAAGPCACDHIREEMERLAEQLRIERGINRRLVAERDRAAGGPSPTPSPAPTAVATGADPAPEAAVTVVLMSYPKSDRFHRLDELLRRFRKWDFVSEILLVWNGERALLPERIERVVAGGAGEGIAPIRVLPQVANRLDNRWRVGREIRTVGVLNVDDDVDMQYKGARCLLDVWRAAPGRLVGIDVRAHTDDPAEIKAARRRSGYDPGAWAYRPRHFSKDGRRLYSIALPRALMGHRRHWERYDAAADALRGIIDELLCDDIAFNFVAANTSNAGPLYARAPFVPFSEAQSAKSLQKLKGMRQRRQQCLSRLESALGTMPLRYEGWYASCSWDGESGNHGREG